MEKRKTMSDRKRLIELLEEGHKEFLFYDQIADHLIANGVVVRKHGRWKLHKHGEATCDQCCFTQENVWDYDNWQRYCGVCGALMDKAEGDGNADK